MTENFEHLWWKRNYSGEWGIDTNRATKKLQ